MAEVLTQYYWNAGSSKSAHDPFDSGINGAFLLRVRYYAMARQGLSTISAQEGVIFENTISVKTTKWSCYILNRTQKLLLQLILKDLNLFPPLLMHVVVPR